MDTNTLTIGFIGAGNMAEALIAGLISKNFLPASQITACEINTERAGAMQKKYGITMTQEVASCVKNSRVIILCVKPQQMKETLASLSRIIKDQLVISIAAGIPLAFYDAQFASQTRVIRVMPNTPALLGLGATAFVANAHANADDIKICEEIFAQVGLAIALKNEADLDAVTALSGSGPAFVYTFAAELIASATRLGLNESVARELTLQTLTGAAAMLQKSGDDPQTLTRKVTSPGGTTFAGLEALKNQGFAAVISGCLRAAAKRSKELSEEFGK